MKVYLSISDYSPLHKGYTPMQRSLIILRLLCVHKLAHRHTDIFRICPICDMNSNWRNYDWILNIKRKK